LGLTLRFELSPEPGQDLLASTARMCSTLAAPRVSFAEGIKYVQKAGS
jgi:hypothetical protein